MRGSASASVSGLHLHRNLLRASSRGLCSAGPPKWNVPALIREVTRRTKIKLTRMDKVMQSKGVVPKEMTEELDKLKALKAILTRNPSPTTYEMETIALPLVQKLCITVAPPSAKRRPYHLYKSDDDIHIYVGRTAPENDLITLNEKYRNDNDWWLHVSGFPGSHVVVRCPDDDIFLRYKSTLIDAALLAVKHSRAKAQNCDVTVTRCKHVWKPKTLPPGQVSLAKVIAVINVDVKKYQKRLNRLNGLKIVQPPV